MKTRLVVAAAPKPHDEVLDDLDILICGLDARGTIVVFNHPCETITGLPRETAVGMSWLDLFAIDERREHVQALWTEARAGIPAGPYNTVYGNHRSLRWQFSRPAVADPVMVWALGFDMTAERVTHARELETVHLTTLDNLVSGLTHELRNPLNSALLQLAVAQRRSSARSAGAVERAASELRRVSALLDDFVVFVRPDPLRIRRIDVRRIVEHAIERCQPRATSVAVTVVLEAGADASAELDEARIEIAVYHLLANAIDAVSAVDGEVRVRVDVRGNSVVIEVEDRGSGPSDEARIFEAFYTTKLGGTGLGLSIVERAAVDHGGRVTHVRIDGTTRFRLELPIVRGASS